MPDHQPKYDQTLSEISHLFLSSLRERQTRGAVAPVRRPPAASPSPESTPLHHDGAFVELTPEEVARVAGPAGPVAVEAILASHFGTTQLQRARDYASHLAAHGERVALIELDAGQLVLRTFERATAGAADHRAGIQCENPEAKKISEVLAELGHDIDRCLVLITAPRSTEARSLLMQIPQWVLLASCEHDGIVAAYRTLKGMAELRHRNDPAPRLLLAVLDARDQSEASRVLEKLAGVSEHFLNWHADSLGPVAKAAGVCEHLLLSSAAPHWRLVGDFLNQFKTTHQRPETPDSATAEAQLRGAAIPIATAPVNRSDVLDLPSSESSPHDIVAAVLRNNPQWIECPLHPPMAEQTSLAVSRERRLVLVAAARKGLADLRSIAQAYRWLIDNRPLIAMAMPQLSIDADQLPQLNILVDHADMTTELLQPLLESRSVTVQAYRQLRWGDRTGLLLEAA